MQLMSAVRGLAFGLAFVAWFSFVGCILVYKRNDVKSLTILAIGPIILLNPKKYLRNEGARKAQMLFRVFIASFAVAFVVSWLIENLPN